MNCNVNCTYVEPPRPRPNAIKMNWPFKLSSHMPHMQADASQFAALQAIDRNREYLLRNGRYATRRPDCETQSNPNHPSYNGAGAMGHLLGIPSAVRTQADAYYSGWDTQARLFNLGTPINGNLDRRDYVFSDLSRVVIQAFRPGLSYSDNSRAAGLTLSAVMGVAGLLAGPLGVAVGASVGATGYLVTRPHDAAWQGYSAQYFEPGGGLQVWGTRNFYGWRRSSAIDDAVTVNQSVNPDQFPNFADQPSQYSWWSWNEGHAEPRTRSTDEASQLVQAMARFGHDRAGSTHAESAGCMAAQMVAAYATPRLSLELNRTEA